MNFVFYYIGNEVPEYSKYCISSIKQSMPYAKIIQLSDEITPLFKGVDRIERFKTKTRLTRDKINYIGFEFINKFISYDYQFKDMVVIDPDMMFASDISNLFDSEFDIAIATRMRQDRLKRWYRDKFPYNSLIVSRVSEFWEDCYEALSKLRKITWNSNMKIVAEIVNFGKYNVKILDGNLYNFAPNHEEHYYKRVKVFHFKGNRRKSYMKPIYERFISNNTGEK